MSTAAVSLDEAKARLDVAALWRLLNLPGKPGRSVRCPLHEDRNASFSVYEGQRGGLRWKCHSGCGQGGPVELLARVFDISERDACRKLLELVHGEASTLPAPSTLRPRRKPCLPAKPLILPPDLHAGSRQELRAVAERRELSFAGIELASHRGLLHFASPRGCPAWMVTDGARINAQARRMDGGLWPHIGDVKAWTLPGSRAPWPIGAREAADFVFVVLVEGAPDLLAAHHFIVEEGRERDVAAIAILGSANHFPDDALKPLSGKRLRIFPHADPAGTSAAVRWAGQLESVGCTVDAFRFDGLRREDGAPVKDLNDFACLDPACLEAEPELQEVLPR